MYLLRKVKLNIRFAIKVFAVAILLIAFASFKATAETISGQTIGAFGTPTSNNIVHSGVGTDEIFLGEVVSGHHEQSRLSFKGRSFSVEEEQSFELGEFTYFNGLTIISTDFNETSIPLEITLNILSPEPIEEKFIFNFILELTTNKTNDPVLDADILTFPNSSGSGSVIINEQRYVISLLGFQQNGNLVEKFVLPETDTTSAVLVGKITTNKIVPEGNPTVPKPPVESPSEMNENTH